MIKYISLFRFKNMKNSKKELKEKRKITGVIIGNKMQGTVKVRVDSMQSHPVYKKMVKRKKVYFASTESELEIGDVVTIAESRPLSKKITWTVMKKEE